MIRTFSRAVVALAASMILNTAPGTGQAMTAGDLVRTRYDIDPQHSSVGFMVTILGAVKVRGRFGDYRGTMIYDPNHPEQSSVTAVVEAKSINTDMAFRDNHLRSPDFFAVDSFPTITFQSDRAEPDGHGFRVVGHLTMHGVTRPVVLPVHMSLAPVSRSASGSVSIGFECTVRLRRQDFGIAGTNRFNPGFHPEISMISDSVEITIELFAQRAGYLDRPFPGLRPPSIADTVERTIDRAGIVEATTLYRMLRQSAPTGFNFSPGQLDGLGHKLLQRGRTQEGLGVLVLNDEISPSVNGVTQSLADAYALNGDRARAVAAYRRALGVDSLNVSAIEMLRRLGENR
jgi:polyisoprenoid-binding protein YceI